ncbi:MAG: hypothetical protein N3D17_06855 [bacterium]|nr:hypothetical protein [bacterium]
MKKYKFPEPDVNEFKNILLRKTKGSRVHSMELHIDNDIISFLWENYLGKEWIEPVDYETKKKSLKNIVELYRMLGFDVVRLYSSFRFDSNIIFPRKEIPVRDTAALSQGERRWADEHEGIIKNWDDFYNYPWPEPEKVNTWVFEYLSEILPSDMGIFLCLSQGPFEILMFLLGFENLCYLMYEDEKLVSEMAEKIGSIIYETNKRFLNIDKIIGIFQSDDMGFKTQTLVSPEFLKKYTLPWHKKLSDLCHKNNKHYVIHSCGNLEQLMDYLIEEVKIDARHSFEDEVMPVIQFKQKYGERVGIIGGVDVGKLCTLKEDELRKYVRNILENCAGSGYILGSGNSIANYVPPENFLIMLDEGYRFRL